MKILWICGLPDRVLENGADVARVMARPIDWPSVNARVAELRRRGRDYLSANV